MGERVAYESGVAATIVIAPPRKPSSLTWTREIVMGDLLLIFIFPPFSFVI
jgi:hypothetical protein